MPLYYIPDRTVCMSVCEKEPEMYTNTQAHVRMRRQWKKTKRYQILQQYECVWCVFSHYHMRVNENVVYISYTESHNWVKKRQKWNTNWEHIASSFHLSYVVQRVHTILSINITQYAILTERIRYKAEMMIPCSDTKPYSNRQSVRLIKYT